MTEAELAAVAPQFTFTPALHVALDAWVQKHYRDRITQADLADPQLAEEALAACDALETVLGIQGLYAF